MKQILFNFFHFRIFVPFHSMNGNETHSKPFSFKKQPIYIRFFILIIMKKKNSLPFLRSNEIISYKYNKNDFILLYIDIL